MELASYTLERFHRLSFGALDPWHVCMHRCSMLVEVHRIFARGQDNQQKIARKFDVPWLQDYPGLCKSGPVHVLSVAFR